MTGTQFQVYVLLALTIKHAEGRGVNLGLCDDEQITCPCGQQGLQVTIPIERCTYFYRWKPYCKACDEYNQDALCSRFRFCADCINNRDGMCLSCPDNRHGRRCQSDCGCQNGARCDTAGRCHCSTGYEGRYCERRQLAVCNTPPAPHRGHVQATQHTEGNHATYTCQANHILIGERRRTCMANGQWSGQLPTCEYTCTLPEVTANINVEAVPNTIDPTVAELVREVQFRCNDGYVLQGAERLHCLHNGQWHAMTPICVQSCGQPADLHNGRYEVAGNVEGSVARYTCNEGWTLSGDAQMTCTGGTWSGEQPTCNREVNCPRPAEIADGQFNSTIDTYPVTSVLAYVCDENFILRGPQHRVCHDDGHWSGLDPRCESLQSQQSVCPEPEIPDNGHIERRELITVFSPALRIRYRCNEGYVTVGTDERQCDEDGNWSGSVPRCIRVLTCDDPGMPKNALRVEVSPQMRSGRRSRLGRLPRLSITGATDPPPSRSGVDGINLPEGKFIVYTRFNFQCESTFYELVGSRQRRCRRDGTWSGRQPTCIPLCGKSSSPRLPMIINGNVSNMGQWPWQVGVSHKLQDTNDWYIVCGGSLLNDNWMVTAAHCVTYAGSRTLLEIEKVKLYLGKHFRNDENDDGNVRVVQAAEIHVHPDYTPNLLDSDIALVRLNETITFTERIRPVCLPSADISEIHLRSGTEGVVIGWGNTEDGEDSESLRMTTVRTISSDMCRISYAELGYPQTVTRNMFCAGNDDGENDACTGDSGGPLVFPYGSGDSRSWYLQGIVSWGSPLGCGVEMQYGGYTKIIRFIDWIHEFI